MRGRRFAEALIIQPPNRRTPPTRVSAGAWLPAAQSNLFIAATEPDIDDARAALKKLEDEAFKRRIAARNAQKNPDKARLLAEMAADRAERAARDPVTRGSVAVPRGVGTMQTASGAGCSGTSGG